MGRPIVAIVGRPNVGKSTLFNRLAGKRIAIVEDIPGITRDRLYADAEWRERGFVVTDTGGIIFNEQDPLKLQVKRQAELAMDEADVIVMIVDVTEGVTPTDEELAVHLRKTRKPVLLAANKADNVKLESEAAEFYSLGLGEVRPVSSLHGRGVAELLDAILDNIQHLPAEEEIPEEAIKLAIIGRPNVGKSSILNAILGEERSIVSSIPGTTRDTIDTVFQRDEDQFALIDTAGIRRAGKIQGSIEYYTVLRAIRAIERSEVALLIVDAADGVTDGDKRVGGYAHQAGKGCVIVVNKWDLRRQGERRTTIRDFTTHVRKEMQFLSYAPVAFASALEGKGISEILDTAKDVAENCALRISTGELNRIIGDAVDARPRTEKGRAFKVKYATMVSVKPPTILLFVNDPDMFHFSYRRYLENQIRKTYSYEGSPIRIIAKTADKEKPE
ncbi:MAG: ribosome biogenesis GTPase Der [Armatimonadota bacterium]|nr:ribosome biogenesis GTPase Der [Armatimonadota bacterium]